MGIHLSRARTIRRIAYSAWPAALCWLAAAAWLVAGCGSAARQPAPDAAVDDGAGPDGGDLLPDGGDALRPDAGDGVDDGSDAGIDGDADEGVDGGDEGTDGADEGGDSAGADDGDAGGDVGGDSDDEPPLFDLEAIRDPSTAQCTFTDHRTALKDGVLLDVWNLSYVSWESIDGALEPIMIRAFAAKPADQAADLPGVVQAHGLGGYAEQDNATGPAALLHTFVVAYTGPGGGTEPDNSSEGLPASDSSGYRMFDTLVDVRGSWFWAHTVAALRALTCLQQRPEVDPDRLGMTGFSAGAVATLLAAGADDRIVAAVPLSGTLAWDVATEAPQAWQHALLAQAGLSDQSQEWLRLMDGLIAPSAVLAGTNAAVLMVDGTTDEFFPLTAYLATYEAIASPKRASLAANFDHGCYSLTGIEDSDAIEQRAELHASGAQRMWFGHFFGTNPDYAALPEPPAATVQAAGQATLVLAQVDESVATLEVENVKIWWSNDDAFAWGSLELEGSGGVWQLLAPFTLQANTTWFVDVQYKTKSLLFPERFTLSTTPSFPDGFVPHIRALDTCL